MKATKRELFQVSAKAVLFNPKKSKIILLHRDDDASKCIIPGGHIEQG